MKSQLLGLALSALLLSSAGADTTIRFERGKFGKKVHGAVVRGTRETYRVGAAKGQTMTIWITSLEDNAVFQVFHKGGTLSKPELTEWSGKLPANGDYLIEVGPTRGNATFDLNVEIR